jgi:hypothetical protein
MRLAEKLDWKGLILVYLSISTCCGRLCAHHQEKHLCLCDTWYLLVCVGDCLLCSILDSHPHRITITKCRINTVVSPDDGNIVARNTYRLINILRINCAPSWLYLKDYTGTHGQQKIRLICCCTTYLIHDAQLRPRAITFMYIIHINVS